MDQRGDLALFVRWCRLTLESLGAARAEIDALNVFPVPDGDTGTNLYVTFEAAMTAVEDAAATTWPVAARALGRGALLGARGNSGVILSQLLRAAAEEIAARVADPCDETAGDAIAAALSRAAEAGYAAVAKPVEGTILTVARAAAEAAVAAAAAAGSPSRVISAAAAAAREALARTPEQLERLRLAGVVDAGGRGLCVLLDAAETVLTGQLHPSTAAAGRRRIPARDPAEGQSGRDIHDDVPAYEVMYLLDADEEGVERLRGSLAALGDSLVVVGGDGLWNVHVHVDDVGAAVEAGVAAGTPHRIRVANLAEQALRRGGSLRAAPAGRGLVAVAAGPGLAQLFKAAGATVVSWRPGRRCSTGEILDAIRRTGAGEVIVLPNDPSSIVVAEAAARAARDEGLRVGVIPTRAQVQGLAAIAVHEPASAFEDDTITMTAAGGHTRHGAVTIAARDAFTMAGTCQAGDALGVVDGDFAVIGTELGAVALDVTERLLAGGGELVTVVTGADSDPKLADGVVDHVHRHHPEIDTVVYDGGQCRYPLLLAVE